VGPNTTEELMERLVVKKSIEINAPASKVWDIIASPDTWERWMLVVPEVENVGRLSLGTNVLRWRSPRRCPDSPNP
jgi:uncharacterized protein YndB with AHSA1/START domain